MKPEKDAKRRAIFLGIAFIILAGLSAVRYSVGYDYSYGYAPHYQLVLDNPQWSIKDIHFEPAYGLLEKATSLLSQNYQMIFVTSSILMIALIMFYYYKASPNATISVFLFLGLCQYYCSLNLIRNTLAAIICMFAFPFLKKKKIIPYILIVLVAATFHKSALLMIAFYFINLIPIKKYTLLVYSVITAFIYLNLEKIMLFVTQYWYSGYRPKDGAPLEIFEWPFTIFEFLMFLIVLLFSKRLEKKDATNSVYVNYAFFSLFFTLMGTKYFILDRFGLYFVLAYPISFAIILMSLREEWVGWKQLRDVTLKKIAYPIMLFTILIGTLAYHSYSLSLDHHGVVPYMFIFDQPFYTIYLDELEDDKSEATENSVVNTEEETIEEPIDEPNDPAMSSSSDTELSEESNSESMVQSPEDLPDGAPVLVDMEEFLS